MGHSLFSVTPQKVKLVNTKNRIIKTKIPLPNTDKKIKTLSNIESRSMHGQLPIIWDRAEGYKVYDSAGNCWIDFTSTIFVTNTGHSNKRIFNAIKSNLNKQLISSYSYVNETRIKYLQKLLKFAGSNFEKAFLMSAGTEATEAALKLMRMHGERNKKKRGIIGIKGNWHGRTLGAQMLGYNKQQKEWIGYSDKNIHHIDFPLPWKFNEEESITLLYDSLEKLKKNGIDIKVDICGFMLETFQGWGAIFYPKKYVQEINKICKKFNILLTFDEMQSGFGRTGKKFGYQHYGVDPDLICIGKAMGGGVPVSGVLGKSKIMDLPEVGNMSSTHSANPLVCAAGIAVIEEIEKKNLVNESHRKGKILIKELNKIKKEFPNLIFQICGKGLLAAIHFKKYSNKISSSYIATRISEKCMQKGLLVVHTGRESIKVGPPLIINDNALLEGINVLRDSIKDFNSEYIN